MQKKTKFYCLHKTNKLDPGKKNRQKQNPNLNLNQQALVARMYTKHY